MVQADWTIALVVLGGVALAFQAGVNGTLGRVSGNQIFSAVNSFVSGLIPLVVYWLASTHGGKDTDFSTTFSDAPWYSFFGGIMGAYYVGMIIFLIERLGAATILSTAVACQVTAALIFDATGSLGLEQRTATPGRIIGVVLTAFGVFLMVGGLGSVAAMLLGRRKVANDPESQHEEMSATMPQREATATTINATAMEESPALSPPRTPLSGDEKSHAMNMVSVPISSPPEGFGSSAATTSSSAKTGGKIDITIVFAMLGGVALALQGAMNGKLGEIGGGGFSAAWSFASGSCALGIWFLYDLYFGPTSRLVPEWTFRGVLRDAPAWSFLGGFLGAAYVLAITILIPRLGSTTALSASIAGQIVAATVLDHFALVGLPRTRAGPLRLAGVAIIIAGAVMISVL
ncbi:hypothetical protein HDU87_007291 [Geranomyces variabilis]|uniref:DMT family transporter n=1 Tax=Geranomyces variabilis TaxID=109894 RepID=A0AAD5TJI6_9FUNG|nr:hypothetical protein HDU87_007291 [Geranomyces variabilis]